MKNILYILIGLSFSFSFSQKEDQRIETIKNQLTALSTEVPGLTENVKTEVSVESITLSNFLLALSEVHKVNINVSPELNQTSIVINNFTNATVTDLLVFLCKEYSLTIDFTGNILSFKRYIKVPERAPEKIIPVSYDPEANTISIDAKGDKLYDVFKQIMDVSGKNLVYAQGLDNELLTVYIQDTPFEAAMDKLAFANNLYLERSKDGFFMFEGNGQALTVNSNNNPNGIPPRQRPQRRRNANFYFKVLSPSEKRLEVDFADTPIADIINDIGNELNIDIFTATPLDEAGFATFKAKNIGFDELLVKLFESQPIVQGNTNTSTRPNNNSNNLQTAGSTKKFTFKKENNIYFFGTEDQLSVRKVAIVRLKHRSVELLSDPTGGNTRRAGRSPNFNNGIYGGRINNSNINNRDRNQFNNTNTGQNFGGLASESKSIEDIFPKDIWNGVDVTVDYELNSFYVNGPSANVERFIKFANQIDKPVPVILIEVMLIEVTNSSTIETGVSWGIGDEPKTTKGDIFPETNITLGARTINKVIGGFDGFGSFNLGKVVPNFFATIKAMESNGNLKVRSTPKLATLNGHRATFSNGQTSYYTVTDQAIIGSDNPITQTVVNYVPIDAELGITIKPLVSGDGQVTLDIFVVQSDFGDRIDDDAPPNINSREFSSIIRVKDQDIVVLGGLEEQLTNNSGSGVPFLARIPIIKWLFSKRKREARKAKLTVLIKPTIIN